jgi:O-antigen ligase
MVKGGMRMNENRLNFALLLFLGVAFMTIPFAYVKMRAWTMFIRIFKFFAIYMMIVAAIDTEKKLKGFIYVYLAMICLIFVEPFILSLQGKGFIWNNHMLRLAGRTGMFAHPNALGMITAANLPFFYYFMRYGKSRVGKIVCFTLILIGLRVIMLTQSRTAFVGVLTFAFFVWIMSRRKVVGLLIGVLFLGGVWQFAPQEAKDRFLTLGQSTRVVTEGREGFSDEDATALGSMVSRWELMRHSFIAFAENPVLGLGLNCFASFSGRRWGLWYPPHNTYLQLLAETGIIGFLAILLVIIFTLKNLRRARDAVRTLESNSGFLSPVVPAVMTYYGIWLVVSFFGIELYNNFWWVAGGLSVVILRVINQGYQTDTNGESVKTPINVSAGLG